MDIFKKTLPRIYQICEELDRRCRADLERTFPGDEGKINYMAVLGDNQVRMANICCYVCHSINGVSQAAQRDHQAERVPRLFPVQPAKNSPT